MPDTLSPFRIGSSIDPAGTVLRKIVAGTVTLNPASIAADTVTTETVAAAGVEPGMLCFVVAQDATAAEPYSILSAQCTTADQIIIKLGNMGAAANDPGSQTWNYLAFKI